MKSDKNILIVFFLNMTFSLFEFIGGILTGSCAISSDSIHDFFDASSIGLSYCFEKKSRKAPDENYTFGYGRYSLVGSVTLTLILIFSSLFMIYHAIEKIITPKSIDYEAMIVFAVIGFCVNFFSAFFTRHGESLNEKAVNLHMIEDVLGWGVVLVGAVVMKFTDYQIIDPLMSIIVSSFILFNSIKNIKETIGIFLEKKPTNIDIQGIRKAICENEKVSDVHHIHVWSIDGTNNFATMHIVTDFDIFPLKTEIKGKLKKLGIYHSTLEFEKKSEQCIEKTCVIVNYKLCHHHKHK